MAVTIIKTAAAASMSNPQEHQRLHPLSRTVSAPVSRPQLSGANGKLDTINELAMSSPTTHKPFKHSTLYSHLHLLISRLRLDRNTWRDTALDQASELQAQPNAICSLMTENAQLRSHRKEDVETITSLSSMLENVVTRYDKLVVDLADARRHLLRVKKSDRAKGKVQQKNLTLKALLNRFGEKGVVARSKADADTEAALREALAAACERVEELEARGEALLDALEERDDASDDEDDMGGDAGVLGAEIAFRGILEDGEFKEARKEWADLLEE